MPLQTNHRPPLTTQTNKMAATSGEKTQAPAHCRKLKKETNVWFLNGFSTHINGQHQDLAESIWKGHFVGQMMQNSASIVVFPPHIFSHTFMHTHTHTHTHTVILHTHKIHTDTQTPSAFHLFLPQQLFFKQHCICQYHTHRHAHTHTHTHTHTPPPSKHNHTHTHSISSLLLPQLFLLQAAAAASASESRSAREQSHYENPQSNVEIHNRMFRGHNRTIRPLKHSKNEISTFILTIDVA